MNLHKKTLYCEAMGTPYIRLVDAINDGRWGCEQQGDSLRARIDHQTGGGGFHWIQFVYRVKSSFSLEFTDESA